MPIFSNVSNFSYASYLNRVSQVSKSLQRLSTGLERPTAADGAAIDALGKKLQLEISGSNAIKEYLQTYDSYSSLQDTYLQQVQDIMDDMVSLAAASLSATSASERANLNTEFAGLAGQVRAISDNATFNSRNLFNSNSSFNVRLGIESTQFTHFSGVLLSNVATALSGAAIATSANASAALQTLSAQVTATNLLRVIAGNHASIVQRSMSSIESLVAELSDAEEALITIDQAQAVSEYTRKSVELDSALAAIAQSNNLTSRASSLISNLI